jgi:drug/metabolite transporter (DMT)-like permease
VFGVIGAVVLLGERPPLPDIIGFAFILAAVVLDQGVRTWRARPAVA